MSQSEYRKLKKSDGTTLLVTIPTAFAHDIPLHKSDMALTLQGKRIMMESIEKEKERIVQLS